MMMGWRARLGFLVPPGNPTVEPEMMLLAPKGVSLHFARLFVTGETGSLTGQAERNRMMIDHIDETVALLAMVRPDVIALAHTASSYSLGRAGEAGLVARLQEATGVRFITAFGSVLAALERLGAKKIAFGTPYAEDVTLQGRDHLQAHGLDVVNVGRLAGVTNIYAETAERAYRLGRQVDHPDAEAVFLSGTGMPTVRAIAALEADLGKPVISASSAMMWHALQTAGIRQHVPGFGCLLSGSGSCC
jgi:maleate isomerase